jgi:RyR domain
MNFHPQPLDTAGVALPADVLAVTEVLARHTHDAWSRQRLADGWRYGPRRDDAGKTHPGLVPYDELTESEKEYDRATALEVLRALVALGFRIEAARAAGPPDARGRRVEPR